eukprot:NODE_1_length_95616_cov_0.657642.p1 type:complete len:1115 gc:universal NODE_1_length_95616_cov_0.657642:20739-17395(-)
MFVVSPLSISRCDADMTDSHLFHFKVQNLGFLSEELELKSDSSDFELINQSFVKLPPGLEHVAILKLDPIINTNYYGSFLCNSKDLEVSVPIECKRKPMLIKHVNSIKIGVVPVNTFVPVVVSIQNLENSAVYLDFQPHSFLSLDAFTIVVAPNSSHEVQLLIKIKALGSFSESYLFFESRLSTVHSVSISGVSILLDVELSSNLLKFPTIDSQRSSQQSIWIKNNSNYIVNYSVQSGNSSVPKFICNASSKAELNKLKSLARPWDIAIKKPLDSLQLGLNQSDTTLYPHSFSKLEAVFSPTRSGEFRSLFSLFCTGLEFPLIIELCASAIGPEGRLNISDSFDCVVGIQYSIPLSIVNLSNKIGLSYEIVLSCTSSILSENSLSGYLNPSESNSLFVKVFSELKGSKTVNIKVKFEGTDEVINKNVSCNFTTPKVEIECPSNITDTFVSLLSFPVVASKVHSTVELMLLPHNSEIELNNGMLRIFKVRDSSITIIASSKWGELGRKAIDLCTVESNTRLEKSNSGPTVTCIIYDFVYNFKLVSDNNYINREYLDIININGPITINSTFSECLVYKETDLSIKIHPTAAGEYSFDIINSKKETLHVEGEFENPKPVIRCDYDALVTMAISNFVIYASFDCDLVCVLEISVDTLLIHKIEYTLNSNIAVQHVFDENRAHLIEIKLFWNNVEIGSISFLALVENEPVEIVGDLIYGKVASNSDLTKSLTLTNKGIIAREIVIKTTDDKIIVNAKRIKLIPNISITIMVVLELTGNYDGSVLIYLKNKVIKSIPITGTVIHPQLIINSKLDVHLIPNTANKVELIVSNPFDKVLKVQFESPKYCKMSKTLKLGPNETKAISLQVLSGNEAGRAIRSVKIACIYRNCKFKQFITIENKALPFEAKIVKTEYFRSELIKLTINHPKHLLIEDGFPKYFKNVVFVSNFTNALVTDEFGYRTSLNIPQITLPRQSFECITKQIQYPCSEFEFYIPMQESRIVVLPFVDEDCSIKYIKYNNRACFRCKVINPSSVMKGFANLLLNGVLHVIPYKFVIKPLLIQLNGILHEYYNEDAVEMNCIGDVLNLSLFEVVFTAGDYEFKNEFNSKESFSIKGKRFINK